MKADLLITGISQLATATGAEPKRGAEMRTVEVIEHAVMAVAAGKVAWVGKASDWTGDAAETVNLGGRAVVPGLIDPHTHAVWAGDRLSDFEARAAGTSYEAILAG